VAEAEKVNPKKKKKTKRNQKAANMSSSSYRFETKTPTFTVSDDGTTVTSTIDAHVCAYLDVSFTSGNWLI
jgi:hypothetical protein